MLVAPLAWAQVQPASAVQAESIEVIAPAWYSALIEGANVRGGPGYVHRVVRQMRKGEGVVIDGRSGEWLRAAVGGWVAACDVRVRGADAERTPQSGAAAGETTGSLATTGQPRRWSLMELTGVAIEVVEAPDPSLVEQVRERLQKTRGVQSDWTILGIRISVPKVALQAFEYSPELTPVVVLDNRGDRYGNVHPRGALGSLPLDLRSALSPRVIAPGETFRGILLFRPTLHVGNITELSMRFRGRLQPLAVDQ